MGYGISRAVKAQIQTTNWQIVNICSNSFLDKITLIIFKLLQTGLHFIALDNAGMFWLLRMN